MLLSLLKGHPLVYCLMRPGMSMMVVVELVPERADYLDLGDIFSTIIE